MENQGGKEKKNGEDLRWAVHLHRRTRDRKKGVGKLRPYTSQRVKSTSE